MSQSVIPFTAKLVKFDTDVPFAEVIFRLNIAVKKEGSENNTARIRSTNNQDELTTVVNEVIGDSQFLYFMEFKYDRLLLGRADGVKEPSAVVYTIGNPLIAQKIVKHNVFAAYNIPPRVLILEKPDGGTTVSYYLPSSVMGQLEGGEDPNLYAILEDLDNKLETLAKRITKTS